jgi:hypothetical protein
VGTNTRLFPFSILPRTNHQGAPTSTKFAIDTHLQSFERANHAAGCAANSKRSPRSAKLGGGSRCLCRNSCSTTQIFKRRRATFRKYPHTRKNCFSGQLLRLYTVEMVIVGGGPVRYESTAPIPGTEHWQHGHSNSDAGMMISRSGRIGRPRSETIIVNLKGRRLAAATRARPGHRRTVTLLFIRAICRPVMSYACRSVRLGVTVAGRAGQFCQCQRSRPGGAYWPGRLSPSPTPSLPRSRTQARRGTRH